MAVVNRLHVPRLRVCPIGPAAGFHLCWHWILSVDPLVSQVGVCPALGLRPCATLCLERFGVKAKTIKVNLFNFFGWKLSFQILLPADSLAVTPNLPRKTLGFSANQNFSVDRIVSEPLFRGRLFGAPF